MSGTMEIASETESGTKPGETEPGAWASQRLGQVWASGNGMGWALG